MSKLSLWNLHTSAISQQDETHVSVDSLTPDCYQTNISMSLQSSLSICSNCLLENSPIFRDWIVISGTGIWWSAISSCRSTVCEPTLRCAQSL